LRVEFGRLAAELDAFTRLNIARTHREADHVDLLAAQPRLGSAAARSGLPAPRVASA
jgi:hypothetical protein